MAGSIRQTLSPPWAPAPTMMRSSATEIQTLSGPPVCRRVCFLLPSTQIPWGINLTVRDKPPSSPAINYSATPIAGRSPSPGVAQLLRPGRRPESAQALQRPGAGADCNRFAAATHRIAGLTAAAAAATFVNDPPHRRRPRARPVSAGDRQAVVATATATTSRVDATVRKSGAGRGKPSDGRNDEGEGLAATGTSIHKNTSSSNILSLLLAEPIRKSAPSTPWTHAEQHLHMADSNRDGSSVEEDIASHNSSTDDDDIPHKSTAIPSNVSLKSSSFTRLSSSAKSSTAKKYVTFSKEPEIVLRTAATTAESIGSGGKTDLPGRVSFSSAEVFELDFSDAEELATPRNPVALNNIKKTEAEPAKPNAESVAEPVKVQPTSCCSLNCSNPPSMQSPSAKKVPNSPVELDESDKIIAEYKREIEKLNRDHEQSIDRICNENKDEMTMENHRNDSFTKKIINDSDYAEKPKPEPVAESRANIDSSAVVINNYLKTTKQLPPISSITSKTPKSTNLSVNNPPAKTSTKPKLSSVKRTTSAIKSEREDSRLNEFQLDKVESWMSIHEFADTKSKTSNEPIIPAKLSPPSYEAAPARRDTPTSKTDDEGMYSFDDQPEDGDGSSTYEEIASVLKEIEESKDYANDENGTEGTRRVAMSRQSHSASVHRATESPDKMREILAYLDGVESSCERTMQDTYAGNMPDSFRSDIEFAVEPDIIGDMPKIDDLLVLPNQQLARRVIALSLRANELASAIQLSRQHMATVRTEKVRTVRAEKQTGATRLADQKRHYEAVVQRHQAFIEQLLTDKTALSDKVSALNRRLDSQNQAWQHKLDTELVRMKETTLAAEKIRRERWVRENTKKIKELTVKGLELEINQMAATHQSQMAEQRRQLQQELLQAVEEERAKHEQLESGIREAYALDREAAIEKERNAIRERFERQIASEQQTAEQQKSRLLADFGAEKRRLEAAMRDKELDFERRKEAMQQERLEAVAGSKSELTQRLAALEQKHATELQSLQQQYEADFKIWRREHETAGKMRETERENAIRREAHLERDRQIDVVVARLDAESLKSREELEAKMSRFQEKHANELRQLELSETRMREQYTECRTKLSESEAARDIAQATAKQHAIHLQHIQQLYDAQLQQKDTLKEAARRDVQSELSAVRQDRDAEIDRIHARVQQAVERKDAAIAVLHKEGAALRERCLKLEAIVRQQRQDYCVK